MNPLVGGRGSRKKNTGARQSWQLTTQALQGSGWW